MGPAQIDIPPMVSMMEEEAADCAQADYSVGTSIDDLDLTLGAVKDGWISTSLAKCWFDAILFAAQPMIAKLSGNGPEQKFYPIPFAISPRLICRTWDAQRRRFPRRSSWVAVAEEIAVMVSAAARDKSTTRRPALNATRIVGVMHCGANAHVLGWESLLSGLFHRRRTQRVQARAPGPFRVSELGARDFVVKYEFLVGLTTKTRASTKMSDQR